MQLLFGSAPDEIEHDMRVWRRKICDAVFYFFSFFGFFTCVPSVILAIREGLFQVAVSSVFLYLFCLCLTFIKSTKYLFKSISGSFLFFCVGIILFFVLGPRGAGGVWLFSTTMLAALLIGTIGAIVAFGANVLTQLVCYLLIQSDVIQWHHRFGISSADFLISAINFILLNFVIMVANAVFTNGFKNVMARSIETRDASIIGLAKLAEYRDNDTGIHLKRIQRYAVLIARELCLHPGYQEYITDEYIKDLHVSAILHDIGKVGVPDAILLKPGALSDQEFESIKQHPIIGGDVIAEIEKKSMVVPSMLLERR